ncbi:hypothetical protein N8D56_27515 (plasmid) [Devosia sp. A8/3-2]|nr:hypothetical protein N8D56_27515 [Devosia sp. A8/3-2]
MASNASIALLLEDEPLISIDVEDTLEAAGFAVTTAMACRVWSRRNAARQA